MLVIRCEIAARLASRARFESMLSVISPEVPVRSPPRGGYWMPQARGVFNALLLRGAALPFASTRS